MKYGTKIRIAIVSLGAASSACAFMHQYVLEAFWFGIGIGVAFCLPEIDASPANKKEASDAK